jgi:hypothetical protein
LTLSPQQRQELVRELSEIHWSFAGDYAFFTKNCATLLQQSLRLLLPGFAEQETLADDYLRPDHFFAALRKTSLVQDEKLASLDLAEQQGYYFSSTKAFYEKALEVVRAAMGDPDFDDIDDYLSQNPLVRRQNILADREYLARLGREPYLLDAQILLEELAVVRSERLLFAEGTRYFHQVDIDRKADEIHAQLTSDQARIFDDCLLKPVRQLTSPIPRLPGIPAPDELPEVEILGSECQESEGVQSLTEIMALLQGQNPEQWQRVILAARILGACLDNISFIKEIAVEK